MAEVLETGAGDKANVGIMSGLQKEVPAVKKAVAELLPAKKKSRVLRVDTEEKTRSAEMKLSLIEHRVKSCDQAMAAVNKKLSAARVKCVVLWWNSGEVL